jgi:hypothetical protein
VAHYEEWNAELQALKRADAGLQALLYRGVGPARHAAEAYLIMPVQRLFRYKLLLARLMELTPESEDFAPEFRDLQQALAAVMETLEEFNATASRATHAAATRRLARAPAQRGAPPGGALLFGGAALLLCTGVFAMHWRQAQARERSAQHALEEARAALERARIEQAQDKAASTPAHQRPLAAAPARLPAPDLRP